MIPYMQGHSFGGVPRKCGILDTDHEKAGHKPTSLKLRIERTPEEMFIDVHYKWTSAMTFVLLPEIPINSKYAISFAWNLGQAMLLKE
jgi:hypothetical protein